MYLWDANILRPFGQGHATLHWYLLRVPWAEIVLPSVVVTTSRQSVQDLSGVGNGWAGCCLKGSMPTRGGWNAK